MGTYYTLGVIKDFQAHSEQPLTEKEWKEILNERVDLELFDTKIDDTDVEALLKSEIFSENIADFYEVLRGILAPVENKNMDYYEQEFGQDIENYQVGYTRLYLLGPQGSCVTLNITFVLLFIEGKVIVEEFDIEPPLINWLFRHCKMENKLAGCIVSSIVG